MSAGWEYIVLKDMHDSVLKAVENGDREQIQDACKGFWKLFDSFNLDSGVEWLMKDVQEWTR